MGHYIANVLVNLSTLSEVNPRVIRGLVVKIFGKI